MKPLEQTKSKFQINFLTTVINAGIFRVLIGQVFLCLLAGFPILGVVAIAVPFCRRRYRRFRSVRQLSQSSFPVDQPSFSCPPSSRWVRTHPSSLSRFICIRKFFFHNWSSSSTSKFSVDLIYTWRNWFISSNFRWWIGSTFGTRLKSPVPLIFLHRSCNYPLYTFQVYFFSRSFKRRNNWENVLCKDCRPRRPRRCEFHFSCLPVNKLF